MTCLGAINLSLILLILVPYHSTVGRVLSSSNTNQRGFRFLVRSQKEVKNEAYNETACSVSLFFSPTWREPLFGVPLAGMNGSPLCESHLCERDHYALDEKWISLAVIGQLHFHSGVIVR